MTAFLVALGAVRDVLRIAFFAIFVALSVVCLIDWLVRTRRINAFSPVARFFRQSVEPLMAPIEARIVRSGGLPSHAPWWALAGVAVVGIVVLSLFDFLATQISAFYLASQSGTRGVMRMLLSAAFGIVRIAIIVRVISSWVRVSPYSRWVRWAFTLSEPILRPLRQLIPTIGMIDISPIVAYLLLGLLEGFVIGLT